MPAMDKPLCIIPARGGSKRFLRKNIALLQGKPLLAYAMEAAIKSNVFDLVCVSSDDDEILEIASKYEGVEALRRPDELASDTAQVKDVCQYLLKYFAEQGRSYSEFAVLLPTNPFRTAKDIQGAYDLLKQKDANYVMSLTPYSHPPQRAVWAPDGYIKPYYGIDQMKQTQLLDEVYRHDGNIIFARSEAFIKENEFYGTKAVPFFVRPGNTVDIDSPLDLEWAEFLLGRNLNKKRNQKNE